MLSLYTERLGDLAAQAYELSGRLCGSCRDLHALWPYIRLSRSSTGLEDEGSRLELALRTLIAGGLRRVLIAGSADTGLLALVARAGADHGVNIVVLDICESPLELCRRLASQWSMQIETLRQDLLELDVQQQFDLVLVHGTLHFIAANGRLDVLTRIQHALRPDGRLVLLFNTSKPSTVEIDDNFHIDYAKAVLSELKRLRISLPDNEAAICGRLSAHSRQRQLREGAFARPDDPKLLLETAGFNVIGCWQVDVKLASPARNFVSHISKRRFMTIAELKRAI
jgi:SAM-dependent methyltransferase